MHSVQGSATWFVCDLVLETRVDGDPRAVVHVSTRLICAGSAEDALEKATALGHEQEDQYRNPAGSLVTTCFRGLAGLDRVHDELGHGAELFFSEHVGLGETEVVALLRTKAELNVFAERVPSSGPDYSAAEIAAEVAERIALAGDGGGVDDGTGV